MPRKPAKFEMFVSKGRVVVRRKEVDETTEGGIIIPDSAKEKAREGTIVALGICENPHLRVGARVLFEPFGGIDFIADGEELLALDEGEVLMVVKGGKGADKAASPLNFVGTGPEKAPGT